MKFRAKLTDSSGIHHLAQIVTMLAKITKQYALRICPDKMVFILTDQHTKGANAWCEFPKSPYFGEYNMQGVAANDNEIFLEITSELMANCFKVYLKTYPNVISLKIKLTRKGTPCLSFEIDTQAQSTISTVSHDMNVGIIHRRCWSDYTEPQLPEFDVSLEMPEIKSIRQNLERLKNLGTRMNVIASKNGKLVFLVDSHTVKSAVKYSDLRVYNVDDSQRDREALLTKYSIEFETKHIQSLFPADNFKPTKFICSLYNKRLLHLFYFFNEITLQYFIKGVIDID